MPGSFIRIMGEPHSCEVPYNLDNGKKLNTENKYTLWQCDCQNVFEWIGSTWQIYSVDGHRIKNDLDNEDD